MQICSLANPSLRPVCPDVTDCSCTRESAPTWLTMGPCPTRTLVRSCIMTQNFLPQRIVTGGALPVWECNWIRSVPLAQLETLPRHGLKHPERSCGLVPQNCLLKKDTDCGR